MRPTWPVSRRPSHIVATGSEHRRTIRAVRLDTARRFALSLPETTEEPHFEFSSFRVRKKIFCTVPTGGKTLHIPADPEEVRALVEEAPAAFEEIRWGKAERHIPDWVRVNLAAADRAQVFELLEDAWRSKAPKRVVADYDASATASGRSGR